MSAKGRIVRQRDFSAGELVEHAKRGNDAEIVRAGARTMSDWRILATRTLEQRPARRSKYLEWGRTDEVRMSSTTTYDFCFGQGVLRIRDSTGVIVAAQGGYAWTTAAVDQITWERLDKDVLICFPGMKPKIARWDGASTWTFHDFSFYTDLQGRSRQPFYRYAAPGITMQPSARTGTINVVFSADVLNAAHVGVIFRYGERQCRILTVSDAKNGTALCLEELPPTIHCNADTDDSVKGFSVGDVVESTVTAIRGIVTAVNPGVTNENLTVLMLNNYSETAFDPVEFIIGPTGRMGVASPDDFTTPAAVTFWDEAAFSDYRGWPGACFFDQNRLGLCDMVPIPEGIAWSMIGQFDEFHPGAEPNESIFELVPGKPRVYHVVAGDDQFVFTSRGTFYIPISETNPLKPGSVAFRSISRAAVAQVRPAVSDNGVIFVNASKKRVAAIVPTGQTSKPYIVRDVSQYHSHLFSNPKAIAATVGEGEFPEPYVYVLNDNGSMAVGKYDPAKDWVGWVPWNRSGTGLIEWVSAFGANVIVTTKFTPSVGVDNRIVEKLESGIYLDALVPPNAVPAAMQAQTEAAFEILPEAGIAIGNMTANGGLVAGFDRTTVQAAAACASRAAANGWAGRLLPVALPLNKVVLTPSSDQNFAQGEAGNITYELRGKNTAPAADGSDGTLLGSVVQADGAAAVTVNSGNASSWLYVWARLVTTGGTNVHLAEVRFHHATRVLAAPGGGTGALWFLAGASVQVMDGERPLGARAVTSTGALTPNPGEDLSGAGIVAGFKWIPQLEPFIPHAAEGQDFGQTFRPLAIQVAVAFQQSTGFKFMNREVAAYRSGENQALAPPKREGVEIFPGLGEDFDPRQAITKESPGALRILEISTKVNF